MGYTTEVWELFLEMDLSNSVINERAHVCFAEGLMFFGTEHEDTENISLERLHFSELHQQVLNGEIRDAISIAAVLKLGLLKPNLLNR